MRGADCSGAGARRMIDTGWKGKLAGKSGDCREAKGIGLALTRIFTGQRKVRKHENLIF